MPVGHNTEAEVRKLAESILKLMSTNPSTWIRWRQIAGECYGSAEYETICIALAQLPQWKHLFATADRVVKLTEAGIAFVNTGKSTNSVLSPIEDARKGVKTYSARLKPLQIKIEAVSRVAKVGERYIHAIHIDLFEESIPSETPVEFRPLSGGATRGKIVGQEADGGILYISFDGAVYPSELPARLFVDRAFLLSELAKKLDQMADLPPLFKELIHASDPNIRMIADEDSVQVARQLADLPTPWARFLWGPPGAGKTYALGHLASRIMRAYPNDRILVLAPSNRAVDVFVEQFAGQLDGGNENPLIKGRKILRFGYPRLDSIIGRPELLGPKDLDKLSAEAEKLDRAITLAEKNEASPQELAILRAEFLAAQETIKDSVRQHIAGSQLVATTVTQAYLAKSPISELKWSTVIVDEATMVPPAMCAFLASLATDRFLVAGDPRQLGPVYENRAHKETTGQNNGNTSSDYEWMGRDLFDWSKLARGEGLEKTIETSDGRMARITGQRRCSQVIWSCVQKMYPEVKILADESNAAKLRDLSPHSGKSIVILDTPTSQCLKEHSSWCNPDTAMLAMEVACSIIADADDSPSVAIITPYRGQVKLLRKAIRLERLAAKATGRQLKLESGTVHQFQGSDADIVIFDMVDGPGRQELGSLLQGDTGVRLVTVAVTRPKGKLIILANRDWCSEILHFKRPQNPVLWDLVNRGQYLKAVQSSRTGDRDPGFDTIEPSIDIPLLDGMLKKADLYNVSQQYKIYDNEGRLISRADFAFPDERLAIYCDGHQWHAREDYWQRDIRQRNFLAEANWFFLVFTSRDIQQNLSKCIDHITETRKRLQEAKGG